MGRAHQVVDAHEDGVVVVGYAGAVARSDVAVGQQLVERAVNGDAPVYQAGNPSAESESKSSGGTEDYGALALAYVLGHGVNLRCADFD